MGMDSARWEPHQQRPERVKAQTEFGIQRTVRFEKG